MKGQFINDHEDSGKPEHDINARVVSSASLLQNEKDQSPPVVLG